MENTLRKLPGIGFRILSFIPALNWISLLYIGLINSNILYVICAVAYAVITFTVTSLSPCIWIVGIVHYAVAYQNVKKQIIGDTRKPTLPGIGFRILSFIPTLNWTSLLYLGLINSSILNFICAVAYGVITFTFLTNDSLILLIWIVGIIHYEITYRIVKKQIIGDTGESTTQTITTPIHNMTTPVYNDTSVANGFFDIAVSGEQEEKQPITVRPSYASEDVSVYFSPKSTSVINGFSDIVISGEKEDKQSIPLKPSYVSEDVSFYVSMDDPETKFFTDMKKNASREGKTAPFVPFKSYYPTYDSMNKAQQAWYFYWRSQIRQGNYMDTDVSYIFVLIYELLSGIGWQHPKEGYQKLMQLRAAYRKKSPSLDHYLTVWTFDFTRQYNLKYRLSDVDEDHRLAPSVMTDILIARHEKDVLLKLHLSLIDALCDYSLFNSKFYKDGNQDLMHEAIPRVITLADATLRKNKQKGILDIYGPPRIKTQEYYAFPSAVCPQANRIKYATVKGYSTYPELRAYINELVRYGENTLRELRGYQGRLRGVTIDEETAKLVEYFLKKEYGQQATQANEPSKKSKVILDFENINTLRVQSDAVRTALEVKETIIPEKNELLTEQANEPSKKSKVILDFENINTLRVQSDAVRTALEVKETTIPETKSLLTDVQEVTKEYGQQAKQENEPPKEPKIILDVEKIKKLRVDSDAVRTTLEVKETTIPETKSLLTDIQEVTAIYTAISPSARSLLDRLEKSSWECNAAQEDEPLIAEINRLAERYLACTLLVAEASKIIAEDDYRDELEYIYQNKPAISSEGSGSKLFDSSVLTPEMKEFVDALLPVQQKALYVLITSENPLSDLERIAEEELTMPQLLLDDINDLALQLMGDIIVDAADQRPHILDEYIDLLKQSVA